MPQFAPIGCVGALKHKLLWGFQIWLVVSVPSGQDMIGCLHLLDMEVMMGHCTLRQIREGGSTRHVSMTPTQTARQPGKQLAIFVTVGGVIVTRAD